MAFYQVSDKRPAPSTFHSVTIALACAVVRCRCGSPPRGEWTEVQQGGTLPGAIPTVTVCCLQLRNLGEFNGEKKVFRNYVYGGWVSRFDLLIHLYLDKV